MKVQWLVILTLTFAQGEQHAIQMHIEGSKVHMTKRAAVLLERRKAHDVIC